ncbi:MAG: YebC/PmpR family DNA-binding transcriptional regulator [Chloroflexi bacterium]|nr:YebC/PmpR family DNA-binding transcriptional regulator [Chloroflexota bacterium]MDA1239784.1 YebC/PmpR family DNA-binding transcriptional regulator [Chloroflexota bacterium]MQC25405.1 YebC/PmpR family DNA-binding transcriptional regulator [Chloroflexota bacterium]MQC48048.1 YebC/PmpR family DNA-binding transcriptional regulator [Chloroflexota bacterium]
MSGHSKWSSIKHKKAATDAKKGQAFTKLGRDITMAAKQGDPDPELNAGLRLAIQKARQANMPADNIKRAVERATGGGDAANLEEITYEGYGAGGTAIIVEVVTDNRNRTVADVRHAFSRGGGSMADNGAVSWQFDSRGVIMLNAAGRDLDEVQLQVIEAGAVDVDATDDTSVEVITEAADLHKVREALEAAGLAVDSAELAPIPRARIQLAEKDAESVLKLLERLDELDDVSRVFSNAEFDDAVLEAIAG